MLDRVAAASHPYPAGRFAGRGIVICGGGDVYFTCAWVCIGMLRRLGCTLPVELWYRGPSEMSELMLDIMRGIGVLCVDAYERARHHPVRRLDSWELKPFAIAHSSFEEVLYLDADNVPVRNPDALFESPGYEETGAVFWPDRYSGPGTGKEWLKRSAWEICGVPYRMEPEIESGQLVIDKRRCWRPLMIALHINEHSDFYYAHFYGDKDTYRLAWHRAEHRYALVPHPVKNLGASSVIQQHDFTGRALFQHRSGDKWSLFHKPKGIWGFRHARACRQILAELKAMWRPPVRRLPCAFSTVERGAYEEICAAKLFHYEREGDDRFRLMEFLPDFTIGRGAALMELAWMIEEDKDGEAVLSIRNANSTTCFLRRSTGVWSGRWRVYDRMRVRLRPAQG